jgi:N-acetylneuraminic acid mutarotase
LVIGGNDGRVQNRVESFGLDSKTWSKMPKMSMKRDELAACLGPDGKIYALGGYGGGENSCLSSAERFDFTSGKWEIIAPMNEARRALSAVALPDGIYAIGGYNGKEYVSSVEKYDFFSKEWVKIKSMNKARCTLSAVATADFNYIYAIGGFNGAALSSVERYDIAREEWEELNIPAMLQKRFMHSCILVCSETP